MTVRIAVGSEVAALPYPANRHGEYARAWLVPFARDGASTFLSNVHAELGAAVHGDVVLPFTVTHGDRTGEAYVVSPFTHYVSYLEEELRLVSSRAIRSGAALVVSALGAVLARGRIDRVVMVNNWMLSTNLYPDAAAHHVGPIAEALRARYPDHAVVFRSLNRTTTGPVLNALEACGFRSLVSRRIYLFDGRDPALFRRKAFRRDLTFLERSGYRVEPIVDPTPDEVVRIVALYDALYLQKYSRHNPAFTPAFVALAARAGLLTMVGLRRDGRLDGVLGYFERDGIMTTPLLGYDTSLPASAGLYRMLTVLLSRIARERGLFLHRSSGAATFKRSRGAVPELEVSMVYTAHLPARRRAPWELLFAVANGLGKPMLEKYDR